MFNPSIMGTRLMIRGRRMDLIHTGHTRPPQAGLKAAWERASGDDTTRRPRLLGACSRSLQSLSISQLRASNLAGHQFTHPQRCGYPPRAESGFYWMSVHGYCPGHHHAMRMVSTNYCGASLGSCSLSLSPPLSISSDLFCCFAVSVPE